MKIILTRGAGWFIRDFLNVTANQRSDPRIRVTLLDPLSPRFKPMYILVSEYLAVKFLTVNYAIWKRQNSKRWIQSPQDLCKLCCGFLSSDDASSHGEQNTSDMFHIDDFSCRSVYNRFNFQRNECIFFKLYEEARCKDGYLLPVTLLPHQTPLGCV